ncbi:MAG: GIY-YIG nuclease family protein [Clostridiales bacterium]|nr:GIY-YIG nuclease family protein [Clostridiales bacterium]
MEWTVYILRCADGTLYTGITDNMERRLKAHNEGRGARYTRGRGPVEPVYRESCADKSAALKREIAIKKLSREQKLKLIAGESFDIHPSARKALELLRAAGYEAWLVGGCVRDLLMGKTPHDWDMTTSAEPEEAKAVFRDFKTIDTGLKHGTVTVLMDGEPLEMTTYRIDGEYADNRHPGRVSFTRNLNEDLRRRDFTMNAVAYDPTAGLADPYGGRADIALGLIRCVGEPAERFREDGLRILRALRFSAVLGFEIEKSTAAAVREERELLKNISAERIREELTRLLCGKNAGAVLRQYTVALSVVLPEILPMVGFEQHNEHHCFDVWEHTIASVENIPPEPVLRWAALFHDIGKPSSFSLGDDGVGHFYGHAPRSAEIAEEIMSRLRFDNESRERVLTLVRHHDRPLEADAKFLKRKLNRLGERGFFELLSLCRADNLAQARAYRYRQQHYDEVERLAREILVGDDCFTLKHLAVNGHDLMALGYKGREIGRALDMLLEAVMDDNVENEREALLAYLKRGMPLA